MSRPTISVIIPVYNSAAFFERTLKRVLRQQSPAHEIIIINDGSTDSTQAILDRYKGRIITKTIPNSGCGAARNEGARLASGEYLAFLDADDLWFTKKLKVVAEYAERFPDVAFFCSEYIVYSDVHRRIIRHYAHLPNRRAFNFDEPLKQLPLKLLLANNFVGTPSAAVVKRSLFQSLGGYDPNCKIVEDLDFFLRAAVRTGFVVIGETLFYKHDHERNMSHNKIKIYEGHKQVLQRNVPALLDTIRKHRLEKDFAEGLADVNYILGAEYFDAGMHPKAYRLFWEGLRASNRPFNYGRFSWAVSKKVLRAASFGLVSRKNWHKVFRPKP